MLNKVEALAALENSTERISQKKRACWSGRLCEVKKTHHMTVLHTGITENRGHQECTGDRGTSMPKVSGGLCCKSGRTERYPQRLTLTSIGIKGSQSNRE